MIRQFELVERVRSYNPNANEDLLNRAYIYGVKAHGSQTRASGEPYFNHPVEVAGILTRYRVDEETVATALLHDTLEDTDATYDELKRLFGAEIANMVDGVTKLSKLNLASRAQAEAENLRKLIVAMARDPRVLLVKMADRLHNMRTLEHLRPEKQQRIARETLDIFAPLAARMGMQRIREELEDRAFEVLNPKARRSIIDRVAHLKAQAGDDVAERIIALLSGAFDEAGLSADLSGREKRPFSIWRKMSRKDVNFEQLSDVIAFRALMPSVADCYRALGAAHAKFPAVHGRFKDYISNPKSNGYRGLHTTVIGPGGAHIELQIRTRDMDEVAESGVAAHWAYHDGERVKPHFAVDPFAWLRELAERVERGVEDAEIGDFEAFLDDAKREMAVDQIYCFTPRGEVKGLPLGATALDFAYAVHTDVGHTAVGAKIDGERAALSAPLRNGQTVEIVQSAGQRPTPIWYDMVRTGRARHAIRRELRAQEQADAARFGEKLVQRTFEREGASFTRKSIEIAAKRLGYDAADALLAEIGSARISAIQVLDVVFPDRAQQAPRGPAAGVGMGDPDRPYAVVARNGGVAGARRACEADSAADALTMPVAPCCRPLPGERIIALREPGLGFRLHNVDCEVLAQYEDAMERWIDVDWCPEAAERAQNIATIELAIANEPGSLGRTCALIGRFGANIDDLDFLDRKPDFFRLKIDLEVRDVRHLATVLTALNAQPIVAEARRRRSAAAEDAEASGEARGEAV